MTRLIVDESALMRRIRTLERRVEELRASVPNSLAGTVADLQKAQTTLEGLQTYSTTLVNAGGVGLIPPNSTTAPADQVEILTLDFTTPFAINALATIYSDFVVSANATTSTDLGAAYFYMFWYGNGVNPLVEAQTEQQSGVMTPMVEPITNSAGYAIVRSQPQGAVETTPAFASSVTQVPLKFPAGDCTLTVKCQAELYGAETTASGGGVQDAWMNIQTVSRDYDAS